MLYCPLANNLEPPRVLLAVVFSNKLSNTFTMACIMALLPFDMLGKLPDCPQEAHRIY